MKWIKIFWENFNKIISLLLLLSALRIIIEMFSMVNRFSLNSPETEQFIMTSSFGLSVLGLSICCGIMFLVSVLFWKASIKKDEN